MAEVDFASLTLDIKGWEDAISGLRKKWSGLGQASSKEKNEYIKKLSVFMYKDIQDHFASEKGPSGKWDAWSKAYAEHARRAGRAKKLQWNGDLRKSIIPAQNKVTNRSNSQGVIFYSNAKTKSGFPYAAHHNEGRSSHKGNPRPFLWLSNNQTDNIIAMTIDWLKESFK